MSDLAPFVIEPASKSKITPILGILAGAALLAFFLVQLLTGHLDFSVSWMVMLGIAAPFAWFALPMEAAPSTLTVLGAGWLAYWLAPAGAWELGLMSGLLAVSGVLGGGLAVAILANLVLPVLVPAMRAWLRRGKSDPAAEEAAEGIGMLETYLDTSARTFGPHTLAKMRGEVVAGRKVIGLSGYGGAGKDTAAAGLIVDRDYSKVSLSNKLREFLLAVDPIILVESGEFDQHGHPIPADHLRLSTYLLLVGELESDDWPRAKENPEVRALLQRTGTDAGRRILGENVWVDACMRDLPPGPVVFTSVRFVNEAEAIKAHGGYLVRVERPGCGPVNDHPSETAMDDWDYDAYVLNDDDMKACREQMLNVESVLYDDDAAAA